MAELVADANFFELLILYRNGGIVINLFFVKHFLVWTQK